MTRPLRAVGSPPLPNFDKYDAVRMDNTDRGHFRRAGDEFELSIVRIRNGKIEIEKNTWRSGILKFGLGAEA